MKVLHIITSLGRGGAETMLLRTVKGLLYQNIDCSIISLTDTSSVEAEIRSLGIRVVNLGLASPWNFPLAVRRIRAEIDADRPDLVHSWMYHANATTQIAQLGLRAAVPVISAVHHSLDNEADGSPSRSVARLIDAKLSKRSSRVIFASSKAIDQHCRVGYCRSNATFLPNGFDIDVFCPNETTRRRERETLGISNDAFVIGLVARLDPVKDHSTFFRAAKLQAERSPSAIFLLAGRGMTHDNPLVRSALQSEELRRRCLLVGERTDIQNLLCAIDVACLSSKSEGFPLTLGEAMACGKPCVATNVGDCALLLSDTGVIVPPQDPTSLADAWHKLETMDAGQRAGMGDRARRRIVDHFSMQAYLDKLLGLYRAATLGARRAA